MKNILGLHYILSRFIHEYMRYVILTWIINPWLYIGTRVIVDFETFFLETLCSSLLFYSPLKKRSSPRLLNAFFCHSLAFRMSCESQSRLCFPIFTRNFNSLFLSLCALSVWSQFKRKCFSCISLMDSKPDFSLSWYKATKWPCDMGVFITYPHLCQQLAYVTI